MRSGVIRGVLAGALVLLTAAAVVAQTQKTVTLTGTVVQVEGNTLVVKMASGEVRVFTPPADRRFMIDGQSLTLSQLRPGTTLTATATETATTVMERTVQTLSGKVWYVAAPTVILTLSTGENRMYTVKSDDPVKFYDGEGKEMTVFDLRKGMNIKATKITEAPRTEFVTTAVVTGTAAAAGPLAAGPRPGHRRRGTGQGCPGGSGGAGGPGRPGRVFGRAEEAAENGKPDAAGRHAWRRVTGDRRRVDAAAAPEPSLDGSRVRRRDLWSGTRQSVVARRVCDTRTRRDGAAAVAARPRPQRQLFSARSKTMRAATLGGILVGATLVAVAQPSQAQDKGKTKATELASSSQKALTQLYAAAPLAKQLGPTAHAILVFPNVKKAGLGIGGQYGEGTLLQKGKAVAYYKTTGASFGLQAGGQQYGYAMFFMNAKALAQLDNADGFEVGVGPSVVMVDEGMAKTTTTNTLKDDIYAFVFGQKGLMAGLGLQGNKISRITPK